MIHDGVGVGRKLIEDPVENACGEERVDIADIKTTRVKILAWLRLIFIQFWLSARLQTSKLLAEREGKRLTDAGRQ
jgi:hypothetical protein